MPSPLNILQIAPRLPWPPTDGGAIGIYNITRFLAKRGHRITMLTFADADADRGDLEEFCDVLTVEKDLRNRPLPALLNLFSPQPYTMTKYQSAEMMSLMRTELRERKFDVLHIDHIHMMPYGRRAKEEFGIPVLLREHNFETTIHRRFAAQVRWPIASHWLRSQAERLFRFESLMLRHPDIIAAITPQDAAEVQAVLPDDHHDRVKVIPAGVDTERVSPDKSGRGGSPAERGNAGVPAGAGTQETPTPSGSREDAPLTRSEEGHVVLLGPLNWSPNRDAAEWFVEEIWPLLVEEVPEVRCTIAGSHPPKNMQKVHIPGVTVAGFVEDLDALLDSADVMAVPLRVGGGMRIKLLEFFARGKAVVSTRIGAEGNAAVHREHILLADTAQEFASAIAELLRNPELTRSIARNARQLSIRRYAWPHVAEMFELAYLEVVAPSGRSFVP
ncbi:glycosyltransferase family 4 protein [bacterium]|nr:glycosyltransferase family 4 protein [bacterium]